MVMYYEKYKNLKEENYIFTYTGTLNFKDVIMLKELIERILLIQDAGNKQRRKIINIIIEALQNSYLHGQSQSKDQESGGQDCLVLLGKEKESYFIVFGNYIKKSSMAILEHKLEALSGMEMEELRQVYLETLDKGEITQKGGASLGLLKMFLDSGKDSTYQFSSVDDEYSFFSLKLNVA